VDLKPLLALPNIGRAGAQDLVVLGIRTPEDLKGQDPLTLYRRLEEVTGHRHDLCVLDVLMSVVHFVETGEAKRWWEFTPARKAMLASQS